VCWYGIWLAEPGFTSTPDAFGFGTVIVVYTVVVVGIHLGYSGNATAVTAEKRESAAAA
jgi:hypothetical protein